jgi:hypothetical protein
VVMTGQLNESGGAVAKGGGRPNAATDQYIFGPTIGWRNVD